MKHNAQNLVIFCSFSFLLVSEREKFAIFALSSIQRLAWEHEERKVKTMEKHFCLDDSPMFRMIELDEVDSTNNFLRHLDMPDNQSMTLVTAEFQSAGRGRISCLAYELGRQTCLPDGCSQFRKLQLWPFEMLSMPSLLVFELSGLTTSTSKTAKWQAYSSRTTCKGRKSGVLRLESAST